MKIYQFTPKAPVKSSGVLNKNSGPAASGADFSSLLKTAGTAASSSEGPGGVIFMANRLAAQTAPSADDLSLAGRLLDRLDGAIRSSSPEALQNIHSLEALIYLNSRPSSTPT